MPRTTRVTRRFRAYPLATIPQKKRELLARGVDVIDLGAGDADLAPPPAAVEAHGRRRSHEPALSRYGFGLGLPAVSRGRVALDEAALRRRASIR